MADDALEEREWAAMILSMEESLRKHERNLKAALHQDRGADEEDRKQEEGVREAEGRGLHKALAAEHEHPGIDRCKSRECCPLDDLPNAIS